MDYLASTALESHSESRSHAMVMDALVAKRAYLDISLVEVRCAVTALQEHMLESFCRYEKRRFSSEPKFSSKRTC